MRFIVAHLTAIAVLLHVWLGCAWHQAEAAPKTAQASAATHSHHDGCHRHGAAKPPAERPAESEPCRHDHGSEHSCDCAFTSVAKAPATIDFFAAPIFATAIDATLPPTLLGRTAAGQQRVEPPCPLVLLYCVQRN